MTSQATARLQKELKELNKFPVEGFKVELPNDGNLFEWIVHIAGPPDTIFQGGIFKANMKFPEDYPISPPKMKFLSDFWHPNVYADGGVCISILHTPDPLNPEEKDSECWRPIQTVESILVSVVSMLADPNFSSPANVDASVQLRKDPNAYKKKILEIVSKSKSELPADFEMPKARKPVKVEEDDMFTLEDEYDYEQDEEDMEEDENDFDEEGEGEEGEEEEADD